MLKQKVLHWLKLDQNWNSSLYLIKRIVREYARPQAMTIAAAIGCMILAALATAASAKLIQPVIDDIFNAKDRHRLFEVCVLILTTFTVKGLASYGESVLLSKVGLRIIVIIQQQLVRHFLYADISLLNSISTGEVISRIMNDVWFLRNSVTKGLIGMFKNFVTVIALIIVMFYQDWILSLLAIFVFPLAILPIIQIGKSMRKLSSNTQEEISRFSNFLNELFRGIRVVKSYVAEEYEKNRAFNLIERLYRLNIRNACIMSSSHPIMEVLGGIAIVVVIAYGGTQVIETDQSAGGFFSFLAALLLAYEPLKSLANLNASLQEGLAAAVRVFDMLKVSPAIVSPSEPRPFNARGGVISFQNVRFHYYSEKPVLKGIDLTLYPSTMTALVGLSGSGKSTILNLIPRFYDVTGGKITIGDVDIRLVDVHYLRKKIAIVSQEVVLFNDTISQNIRYGNLNADEELVIQAAMHADAHDFILSLPSGYDTMIGENGLQLSGGQRQRIAIARAILKEAPILLLDEATSSLDTKAEANVHRAFDKLMCGRTTLVIAHRLSTVVQANTIYVISDGKILAQGRHSELMQSCAFYSDLCRSQLIDNKN